MWNIIVNPNANNKRSQRMSKKVSKYFKSKQIPFEIFYSERKGDISNIARKLDEKGETKYIIVGGDSTINEFINGVQDISKISFGIVPAGYHNSFASTLGLKRKLPELLNDIIMNDAIVYDCISVGEHKAVGIISMGVSIPIYDSVNSYNRMTKLNYFKSALKNVLTFSFRKYDISIDGGEYEQRECLFLAFCNGKYISGKYNINPHCNHLDETANLIIASPMTNKQKLSAMFKLKSGSYIYSDAVDEYWVKNLSIKSKDTVKVCIDGDIIEMNNPEFSVCSKVLNILGCTRVSDTDIKK